MCRWLAYSGVPVSMDTLLFQPHNSLIRQSLSAQRSVVPTNGDGFGLGWYADLPHPGLFKDTMPAWNDANLRSLAEQIRSSLFFAHVRASTGTATTRLNCHPFRYGRLLFMHNGKIGGYALVRRELEQKVRSEYYLNREGSTDSELFFYLLLGNGFTRDPKGAFQKTVADVLTAMEKEGVDEPFRMAAAIADGRRILALRWSSDGKSPSMFYGTGSDVWIEQGDVRFIEGRGCSLVLSEPLDEVNDHWHEVGESSFVVVENNAVEVTPFTPALQAAA
ncbi:MAG: class II glutamine amidotransferase [Alphaproteobacteria bacterium]|nr:class II glutamine amidotransferase [Alphaproteobacteria bacterium]